jgi:hypothetical protein
MMSSGPTDQESNTQQSSHHTASTGDRRDVSPEAAPFYIEGESLIPYPFAQRYSALKQLSSEELVRADPHAVQASTAREKIETLENNIAVLANSHGIPDFQARWALTELVTNATQYGSQGRHDPTCGHIYVAWRVDTTPHDRSLRLTVSNPCTQLFDPSYYPRMLTADFFNIVAESNGHLFTITMLSLVKPETYMRYVWDLPSGERITCQIRKLDGTSHDAQQPDGDDSSESPVVMCPLELSVSKSDSLNQPMPYSEAEFMEDVKNGLATKYLAISVILPEGKSEES